mgnify:CR=1 FL=1|jgi:hypothetical protein|tara:strand:+ start:466 stop:942 length:477 start_codon:yes stop_codon:yes gene_type:complete
MNIIDNALSVELFSTIRQLCCNSQNLPYYLETDISGMGEEENCYFTHLFYNNDTVCSDYMKWGQALKDFLKAKSFMRIKANLYPRTDTIVHHKDHVDLDFDHNAAILYLNTNNGYTVIGDTKIESVANRILLFNPQIPHHSTTCTDAQFRANINFNYF